VGDYVYGGHGHRMGLPICVELATAGRVGRGHGNRGGGSAAAIYSTGTLLRYENGVMMLIEATPQGYREKGSFTIPDVHNPSWSHPVIADGRLYLREQDALNVYDIRRR
jgi:hypothetical protein